MTVKTHSIHAYMAPNSNSKAWCWEGEMVRNSGVWSTPTHFHALLGGQGEHTGEDFGNGRLTATPTSQGRPFLPLHKLPPASLSSHPELSRHDDSCFHSVFLVLIVCTQQAYEPPKTEGVRLTVERSSKTGVRAKVSSAPSSCVPQPSIRPPRASVLASARRTPVGPVSQGL